MCVIPADVNFDDERMVVFVREGDRLMVREMDHIRQDMHLKYCILLYSTHCDASLYWWSIGAKRC